MADSSPVEGDLGWLRVTAQFHPTLFVQDMALDKVPDGPGHVKNWGHYNLYLGVTPRIRRTKGRCAQQGRLNEKTGSFNVFSSLDRRGRLGG